MRGLRSLLVRLRARAGSALFGALALALAGAAMGLVASLAKPLVATLSGRPPAGDGGWQEFLGRRLVESGPLALALALGGLFVLRAIALYVGQYATAYAGARVVNDLRRELFDAYLRQPPIWFDARHSGDLAARVVNDTQLIHRAATVSLADGVRVAAMVPALFVVALVHDAGVALIAAAALPLVAWPALTLGKKLRRAARASLVGVGSVAGRVTELVGNARIVQLYGGEARERERFDEATGESLRAELRAARARALASPATELVAGVVGALLVALAGRAVAAGRIEGGDLAVVGLCLALGFASIRRLNSIWADLQLAGAAMERVLEVIERRVEIVDGTASVSAAEIELEGVVCRLGEARVLDGVDLRIAAGETIALVGASGAGKTTLTQLLPRFLDPDEGTVRLGGTDLRDLRLAELRGRIGWVDQQSWLFDDTIARNIGYPEREPDRARLERAAKEAQASAFIESLPDGYDQRVGERGARLSVGQAQRLALARAFYRDPELLILDEPTAALDAETEAALQLALDRLASGRTCVIVAHRLSTIRRADRIVVMERGRVVEQGTHDALLARGGHYGRLHALQER